ncbi:TraJ protein [Salmonella enterica subsp. arizonae]|nr:TraJ protein [Salmonella enterica subsp. arizonae]
MVIIDPIRMEILRKIFPEINDVKIEVFTLFAFGMSI